LSGIYTFRGADAATHAFEGAGFARRPVISCFLIGRSVAFQATASDVINEQDYDYDYDYDYEEDYEQD
jgi:hypothetical protein